MTIFNFQFDVQIKASHNIHISADSEIEAKKIFDEKMVADIYLHTDLGSDKIDLGGDYDFKVESITRRENVTPWDTWLIREPKAVV